MNIYLAADHGGFNLKQQLLNDLPKQYTVIDCGNQKLEPEDDYPDFVANLAQKMLNDQLSMGIVICRNGVGVSIAANRFPHLRCGLGFNDEQIRRARRDDNINVLALPADYLNLDQAKSLINLFLETEYSGLERYSRRLAKVNNLDHQA